MRINVAQKMINQFEIIIDKVENESEKLSFDFLIIHESWNK